VLITDVRATVIEAPSPPIHFRPDLYWGKGKRETVLLTITADNGLEGQFIPYIGMGKVIKHVVEEVFRPALIGEDPLSRERLWYKIYNLDLSAKAPIYVHGALDVALWDLIGKALNVPLYKLLGAYRDRIKSYASTLTFESLEDYANNCKEYVSRGYKAIKLHAWGDMKRDMEACRVVREAVGEDIVLMFDAALAYDHEEALSAGRELEKLNYYWYEDPLKNYDTYGYRELRSKLRIPLVIDESASGGVYEVASNILAGNTGIVHSDVFLKGGITGLMKIAGVCEAFGIKCQVHGPGVANLHAACAVKNCEYYESIVPEDTYHFGVKEPPIVPDENGFVCPPNKPGLGYELDWDWIHQYAINNT
jgi:L-alanine-DL-glutamate epimerase-like enolase superfamily enzyme